MEPRTGASTPPPPPPSQPPPPVKKKTSPWVWILVGCGGLIVVGMILAVATGAFLFKKGAEKLGEFAENPIRTAAETMVRLNPDLELVSTDDEAETMTIRNTKTGEVSTFDWSDIQNGRFSFESDGQEYTLDGSGAADGQIKVEDGSGGVATFGLGSGDVPSWFPNYPNSVEVQVLVNATQNGQESRIWTFKTSDDVSAVLRFYDEELKKANWEVTNNTSSAGEISSGSVDAKADSGARVLNLVVSKSGAEPAQVMVTYTGTPSP